MRRLAARRRRDSPRLRRPRSRPGRSRKPDGRARARRGGAERWAIKLFGYDDGQSRRAGQHHVDPSCRSRASRASRRRSSSTRSSRSIPCARRRRSRTRGLGRASDREPLRHSPRQADRVGRAPRARGRRRRRARLRRARAPRLRVRAGDGLWATARASARRSSIAMSSAIRRRRIRSLGSPPSRSGDASRTRRGATSTTRTFWDALGRERITTNEQNVVDPPLPGGRPSLETVVLRQLDYGPNGRLVRAFAPYVALLGARPRARLPDRGDRDELRPERQRRRRSRSRRPRLRDDGLRWQSAADLLPRPDAAAGRRCASAATSRQSHGRDPRRARSRRRAALAARLGLSLAQWNAEYDGRDGIVAEWFGGLPATRIERRYDLLGRAISTDDPDAGRWAVRYDEAGNEVFRDDPKASQSIQSCYDGLNRVVLQMCPGERCAGSRRSAPRPQPSCSIAYRYRYDEATPILATANHGLGRLTTVEGPDSRHRYVYDVRGRVILAGRRDPGRLGRHALPLPRPISIGSRR